MPAPSLTPQEFVAKWERVTLNEKATAQTHFNELCRLFGQPAPLDADPTGDFYRFEKPLTKVGGRAGFADVWRKDRFAWEYKTKGKYPDLRAAYQQLLLYKEDLDNPPILVACDIASYEVHIAFTGFRTVVRQFSNADLLNADTRELLRLVLADPERLRPVERAETVTEVAAARFARVAQLLEARGHAPAEVAPFFMKILFALFAEDIQLLPNQLMTRSIREAIFQPAEFVGRARALFRAMRVGDYFGVDRVPQFNGGLFDDDAALALNADELQYLAEAARLDWSQVEPSIFGTLFERSLDPSKRAQLGAHYTSRADILLIVEPVLMAPLRREWAHVKTGVEALRGQWEVEGISVNKQRQLKSVAEGMLLEFMERLAQLRVLDPACGSGNFLYVALNALKDLEKEVLTYAAGVGLAQPELGVTPAQFYGIEKNQFAAELAQVVVWIGYLQWKRTNGFWDYAEPILQTLDTIQCRDAILTVDLAGNPAEPAWPAADVIIGNPPFLGGKRLRTELGDQYVDAIFALYAGRVPREADLVTYWFERARALIEDGQAQRAGLLATQGIRGGANRKVLERIKQTGDIFMAWSDREWILDGAAVHVSIVGFDDGSEQLRSLDGVVTSTINPNLTGSINLTVAQRLRENMSLAYMGDTKGGAFDIPVDIATPMINASLNPNGRYNSDVVRPWVNGLDITRRPRGMWIIDFGVDMEHEEAAHYEAPFTYVSERVKPARAMSKTTRSEWWLHERPRPEMRSALVPLARYIGTPRLTKYRLFVFLNSTILPDSQVIVIARDDDYFFGVLHAKAHELWARATGTQLREVESGFRYTPTTTFETYPFPWPPGAEPQGNPHVEAIAEAARALVLRRDRWLAGEGPPDLPLNQRTLTNLYNRRPDWLAEAHQRLDAAVLDTYGWPRDLSDADILARLLALNLARAAAQGGAAAPSAGDADDAEA